MELIYIMQILGNTINQPMIGIADKSFVQILAYCQYVSIYWNMADLAAFGHISADLRLQAWTFELPQSHSFHRNVNIDRIGILQHV